MKVPQSCLTLYTVHGILQARILEWVAFPFSRGSSQPRKSNRDPPALQVDSLPAELSGKPPDQIDRDSNPSSSLSRTVDLEQIIIPSKLYFFLTVKWGNDVYPRELSGLLEIKYVTSQHRVSIQETVVHLLT